MQKPINDNGIYLLELTSNVHFKISHKKFEHYQLKAGYYYYAGSAQKNLFARIKRHQIKKKSKHWHIDYLTTNPNVNFLNVYLIRGYAKQHECELVNKIIQLKNVDFPLKGFGNSDCSVCQSHLLYSKHKITYNHLCALYHSTVLFIPSSKEICCL